MTEERAALNIAGAVHIVVIHDHQIGLPVFERRGGIVHAAGEANLNRAALPAFREHLL